MQSAMRCEIAVSLCCTFLYVCVLVVAVVITFPLVSVAAAFLFFYLSSFVFLLPFLRCFLLLTTYWIVATSYCVIINHHQPDLAPQHCGREGGRLRYLRKTIPVLWKQAETPLASASLVCSKLTAELRWLFAVCVSPHASSRC